MNERTPPEKGKGCVVPIFMAALFLAPLLPFIGCQSIAGIEDRHYVASTSTPDAGKKDPSTPDAGQNKATSAACKSYCDTVMGACTDPFSVYPSMEVCLNVCTHFDAGDPAKPEGNTLACRAQQAKFAQDSRETDQYCPAAGPGGANVCGTDCESYCTLFGELCPDDVSTNCVHKCDALPDDGTFDAVKNHDGNTTQCRLVHTSNATLDPTTHCGHARISPPPGTPCAIPTPNCTDYCRLETYACSGKDAMYEDSAQCLGVCSTIPIGTTADTVEDTLGCRTYHSFNALDIGVSHCPHTGAGGDGHCGTGNCAPYCRLLKAACSSDYAAAFASDADCEASCKNLPGANKESHATLATAKNGTDSVSCRTLHAARALKTPSECQAAINGDPCE